MACSRLNRVHCLFHKGGSKRQQSGPLSHKEDQRCTAPHCVQLNPSCSPGIHSAANFQPPRDSGQSHRPSSLERGNRLFKGKVVQEPSVCLSLPCAKDCNLWHGQHLVNSQVVKRTQTHYFTSSEERSTARRVYFNYREGKHFPFMTLQKRDSASVLPHILASSSHMAQRACIEQTFICTHSVLPRTAPASLDGKTPSSDQGHTCQGDGGKFTFCV